MQKRTLHGQLECRNVYNLKRNQFKQMVSNSEANVIAIAIASEKEGNPTVFS